jgi:peptidoglycan-N-acetylglucosamine deacetylase
MTAHQKPTASLSLDLDNKWSYMKTHGDAGWDSYPSYLDVVVPRFIDFLAARDLKITVFVVGQDAALERNHDALRLIPDHGHEVGNHSFHHEPWLHLYSEQKIDEEFARTEEALQVATGETPVGFRGPGFSLSPDVLKVLQRRGYQYDCSTFPTFLGPLARMYYFMTAKLNPEEKEERKKLFGTFSEGFKPLRPYLWNLEGGRLLEIPVTTMPCFKVPIHVSYLLYLDQFSRTLAMTYWRMALTMCRLAGVGPSLLLHPLDFMGADDDSDLAFFPAMGCGHERKVELVGKVIDSLTRHYNVGPMKDHASEAAAKLGAPLVERRELLEV